MSSTIETVETVYSILKIYMPAKDMQTAADHLVEDLQELLDEEEMFKLSSFDKYLKASVKEILGDEDFQALNEEYDE